MHHMRLVKRYIIQLDNFLNIFLPLVVIVIESIKAGAGV